jgi:hypothetical protein
MGATSVEDFVDLVSLVRSLDVFTFSELLLASGRSNFSLNESLELAELRAGREKSRARAKHASTRRWKLDESERAARDEKLRSSFLEMKRANPSLSDRRAAHYAGKSARVSVATVLRAVGLKRRYKTPKKGESQAIG